MFSYFLVDYDALDYDEHFAKCPAAPQFSVNLGCSKQLFLLRRTQLFSFVELQLFLFVELQVFLFVELQL